MKVFGGERRDVTHSARGKGSVGRDNVTDCAKGKGSVGSDVMLQTVQGGLGS